MYNNFSLDTSRVQQAGMQNMVWIAMENVVVQLVMIAVACAPNLQTTVNLQRPTAMVNASEQLCLIRVEIVLGEIQENKLILL